jgi:hypothetical protein
MRLVKIVVSIRTADALKKTRTAKSARSLKGVIVVNLNNAVGFCNAMTNANNINLDRYASGQFTDATGQNRQLIGAYLEIKKDHIANVSELLALLGKVNDIIQDAEDVQKSRESEYTKECAKLEAYDRIREELEGLFDEE